MKKIVLFIASMLLGWAMSAQSFQPLNGNFELWDSEAADAEPTHWNSFATSDGTYSGLASSPHHYHRTNQDGTNSYLTIYTRSILGIKANGNMTTGRIHAGSMTPTSPNNYNYTDRSHEGFNQPFTATPDSLYVWVSFYAADTNATAQIATYIHGDYDFQDPGDDGDTTKYAAKAYVRTTRTTASSTSMNWVQLKVPFEYTGTAAPAYLLMSMTTNRLQGAGTKNDSLSVDDIQFIYSSWLTDIKVNGTSIEGFSKSVMEYNFGEWNDSLEFAIEGVTEVSDAYVTIDTAILSVDSVDNGFNVHYRYTLRVFAEDSSYRDYTILRHCFNEIVPDVPEEPESIDSVEEEMFDIYPNPTTGIVNIRSLNHRAPISLMDVTGKVVATWEAGTRQLDVNCLPSGMYFLRQGQKVMKLLKR